MKGGFNMQLNYEEDFRFLTKSMLDHELVVFVGAGVSMGSGLPSWNSLVKEISNRLGLNGKEFGDNSIIPQLYYNTRGKKDYNELVHELLCKPDIVPNESHRCIVRMNPRYIITTNYDDLLEQAFSENGIFLDVIEQDSDLPYAHTDHILIKMHGGFKYNNFVLKEDDYLNYTSNFTLIENYIKALFARYTILFVGYSFNDPDTKQLLSWVRSILQEDQQRAYLINLSDNYDPQTADYYRNMGINVIFAKAFLNKKDDDPVEYTTDTVQILDAIANPQHSVLAKMNTEFKEFDAFNYITVNYIQSVFNQYCSCRSENNLLSCYSENEELLSEIIAYFDESDEKKGKTSKDLQAEYPYIIKTIRKSLVKSISFIKTGKSVLQSNISCAIPNHIVQEDNTLFEEFNFSAIKNETIPHLSDSEEKYLYKSYCYFFLKDYLACYDLLRKAAKHYLATHQLEKYLITENNRIDVGRSITNNPFLLRKTTDQKELIKQEINLLESFGPYADSRLAMKRNSPVADLIGFKYIYRNLYRIIEYGKKVDEEARKRYSMYAGIIAYDKIEFIVQDLYNYMQYNYLLLDVYSETKCLYALFIDYRLLSFSTKEEVTNEDMFPRTFNIVLEKLSRFDVLVILRFLSFSDLKNITSKYKIDKIKLDDEASFYILNVLVNLASSMENHLIPSYGLDIFAKVFYLLKMVDISPELLDAAIKAIKLLLEKHAENYIYDEINEFIVWQYKNRKDVFSPTDLEKMIKSICKVISSNQTLNHEFEYLRIMKNMSVILGQMSPNHRIEFSDKEIPLILSAMSEKNLVYLFPVCSKVLQRKIKQKINMSLKKSIDDELYYKALINDIIQPNEECEKHLLATANNNSIESNYPAYCTNLLLDDKIINKPDCIKMIQKDRLLSLVINPDEYDYTQFDAKLLKKFSPMALKKISQSTKAYEFIHTELKALLLDDHDEKLMEIYLEHFS